MTVGLFWKIEHFVDIGFFRVSSIKINMRVKRLVVTVDYFVLEG